MTVARSVRTQLTLFAGLTLFYFSAGKLGLSLAFVHASATAVWAPTGIALWALLVFGYRLWPAILLGAFLVNVTTAGTAATSLSIAVGNTLEAVVGAYLVNRFANGRQVFDRAHDVFVFAGLAVIVSTMVSATWGVTTLAASGMAQWRDWGSIWWTWWLGDATGNVVVAPLLVLGSVERGGVWNKRKILEAVALSTAVLVVGFAVFGGLVLPGTKNYPLEFLCIPLFIWAAFRFGRREAAATVFVMACLAIWGTLRGFGPFARPSPNESLLLLQAFVGVSAIMTLALATVIAERKEVIEQLHRLASSDPLTGLPNFRHLCSVLDREITRSGRTERPFVVLFFDLDDLKGINDRQGHLAGNHALCRLADVLRHSCRALDTPARFGGDEFAVVLPETAETEARRVMQRIGEQLNAQDQDPTISVSVGLAMYPRDGSTADQLLARADQSLYRDKKATDRDVTQRRRPSPIHLA